MKKIIIILLTVSCYCAIYNTYAQSSSDSLMEQSSLPMSSMSLSNNIEKISRDFMNALNEEENKMPPLYNNIHAVKMNLESLKKLIQNELQNAEGFQIDFIPQYELVRSITTETWAHDSIERYQRAVRNFLTKANYDLIGWEASALDTVTHELYKQELLNNWRETDPNISIDTANFFETIAPQYKWQDGVLAYWIINSKATLIGLEESSLWKLNIKANEFDIPFSYYVAEFRSYMAMAKMIKSIRENKSKQSVRSVIVMGAWHQTDVTTIAKALEIRMKAINIMADK